MLEKFFFVAVMDMAGRPASAGIIIEIDRSEIEVVNRGDKAPLSKGLNEARVNVARKDISVPEGSRPSTPRKKRKVQHYIIVNRRWKLTKRTLQRLFFQAPRMLSAANPT